MSAALHLSNLAHAIADGGKLKPVLAPISRTFEAGRLHVVSGPSGAGKTTLLSLIARFVPPTSGTISFGDLILTDLPELAASKWRRENLGLIFQTSRLVRVLSVAEHVELAARLRRQVAARTEGLDLLDRLGLSGKLDFRPHQLSGGEKQRVALAQAMCTRPSILLADEPTAALDQGNAELVADILHQFAVTNSSVVVCVSHDRTVMDRADHNLQLLRPLDG